MIQTKNITFEHLTSVSSQEIDNVFLRSHGPKVLSPEYYSYGKFEENGRGWIGAFQNYLTNDKNQITSTLSDSWCYINAGGSFYSVNTSDPRLYFNPIVWCARHIVATGIGGAFVVAERDYPGQVAYVIGSEQIWTYELCYNTVYYVRIVDERWVVINYYYECSGRNREVLDLQTGERISGWHRTLALVFFLLRVRSKVSGRSLA